MRCFVCGGEIHIKTPCVKCGIEYKNMIEKIEHQEIIRLIKKLSELQDEKRDNRLEASLLACELENSSLIFPVKITDEGLGVINIPDEDGNSFLPVFTDMENFKEFTNLFPLTNTFDMILKLLDENTKGIVINVNNESCELLNEYIDMFFR